jgi:hypothetical protein
MAGRRDIADRHRGSEATLGEPRGDLVARLQARREEIEQTIWTRIYAISGSKDSDDPAYSEGMRAAVSAALNYGLAGIRQKRAEPGPIPGELLAQVRYAARNSVSLETVLRRYFAGYTLLGDFIMQEAEESDLFGMEDLQALSKAQAMLFDRLVVAVSEEYRQEAQRRSFSRDARRAECARRLLAGELVDSSAFAYDLDLWHLGVIAVGPEAERAIRVLADAVDRRCLTIRATEETVWAWLGGADPLASKELVPAASVGLAELPLAVGEPGKGLSGWRLTHRQASAALSVGMRRPAPLSRYADVALDAALLQDELFAEFLRDSYLSPLESADDGGVVLKQTLCAYFACSRNVSSAAAALRVSRQTVAKRLRAVDELLGRRLDTCSIEMESALRLQAIDGVVPIPPGQIHTLLTS